MTLKAQQISGYVGRNFHFFLAGLRVKITFLLFRRHQNKFIIIFFIYLKLRHNHKNNFKGSFQISRQNSHFACSCLVCIIHRRPRNYGRIDRIRITPFSLRVNEARKLGCVYPFNRISCAGSPGRSYKGWMRGVNLFVHPFYANQCSKTV